MTTLISPSVTTEDVVAILGDVLNPLTGWEATLAGSVSILGFELGKVSGLIFGPQEEVDSVGIANGPTLFAEKVYSFEYPDDFELTRNNTVLPAADDDDIPVYFASQYDNMIEFGGILLTGELQIPDLLSDPAAVLQTLAAITSSTANTLDDPLRNLFDSDIDLSDLSNAGTVAEELQVYLQDALTLLTRQSPLGTLQIFIPSPAKLVDRAVSLGLDTAFGPGDGGGETILLGPSGDAGEYLPPILVTDVPADEFDPRALRFYDLNGNAFYDARIDVLATGPLSAPSIWADFIPGGRGNGDWVRTAADSSVLPGLLGKLEPWMLNDVVQDSVNGALDSASVRVFSEASYGFIDANNNRRLDWSADPTTGAVTFHETLVEYHSGQIVSDAAFLPNLAVFVDLAALEPNGVANGFNEANSSTTADPVVGLYEGFFDENANGRFDLGIDTLYDLNGNGLPDGELFIDADASGTYTFPEPYNDINGNGQIDLDGSVVEDFGDLNENGLYDAGDPVLELGNGLHDPPGSPVYLFRDDAALTRRMLEAFYIDGFADVKILGMPLGDGRLRVNRDGLFVDMSAGPWGVDVTAGLGFEEFNAGEMLVALNDSPLAAIPGTDGLLARFAPTGLGLSDEQLVRKISDFEQGLVDLAGDFSFPFPVVSLDSAFQFSSVVEWLGEAFGDQASQLFTSLDASARVELYSPLFNETPPTHPTADPADSRFVEPPLLTDDLIQRHGGGRVSATLNMPGLVEGAVGVFETQFPNSADDLLFGPDFAFLAKADQLAIPGISDEILRGDDLRLSIVKSTQTYGGHLSAEVTGSVGLFEGFAGGLTASVDGALTLDADDGVYGQLAVTLDSNQIQLGPGNDFQIDADAEVRLLVNATDVDDRLVTFDHPRLGQQSIVMAQNSGSLWIAGEIALGTMTLNGTFQVQASQDGLNLFGQGSFSDQTMALLLGEEADAGFDVSFMAGIQRVLDTSGNSLAGLAGAFTMDAGVNLPFVDAGSTYSVGFNTSTQTVSIDLGVTGVPGHASLDTIAIPSTFVDLLTLDPASLRVFASGTVDLSAVNLPTDLSMSGFVGAQFGLAGGTQVDLVTQGRVDLGKLGAAAATGFLELGSTTAAGYLSLDVDHFGFDGIAEFQGQYRLAFNANRSVTIPNFVSNLIPDISLRQANFVNLEFTNGRVDLFDTVAIGGSSGAFEISDDQGITLAGNLGMALSLPNEITAPLGGLIENLTRGTLPAKVPQLAFRHHSSQQKLLLIWQRFPTLTGPSRCNGMARRA